MGLKNHVKCILLILVAYIKSKIIQPLPCHCQTAPCLDLLSERLAAAYSFTYGSLAFTLPATSHQTQRSARRPVRLYLPLPTPLARVNLIFFLFQNLHAKIPVWSAPSALGVVRMHEYIRYVLPKGSSFEDLDQTKVTLLANNINSEKRDSLNEHSPFKLSQLLLGEKLFSAMNYQEVAADDVKLIPELLK